MLFRVVEMSDKRVLVFCSFIIIFGLIGGGTKEEHLIIFTHFFLAAATFSAVREITSVHFETPCYIKPFVTVHREDNGKSTNCCGPFQNVSVFGDSSSVCSDPDLAFYNG